MAGRNQHHIPQSVLKCFTCDPNERPQRVWEYRRDAPIAPRPTYEVAAQRDFYSKPGPDGKKLLDDRITDYEREHFAPLLRRLLDHDAGALVAHEDAAEYLGHLIPRGDHMRRLFGETMSRFLGDAKSFIGDPDRVARHLGLDNLAPGGEALTQIRRLMKDPRIQPYLALMQVPPQLVERLGFALMREHAGPLLAKAFSNASLEFELMSIDVKGSVREAHRDALDRVGVGHRMPGLDHISFTIAESASELLLPDCVAVAFNKKAEARPLVMSKREDVVAIIAPLTPYRMLIGRAHQDVTSPPNEQLAGQLAACSHMFFVAASDNFRSLHTKLGEVSDPEVDRVVQGVFERPISLLPPGEAVDQAGGNKFTLRTPVGFEDTETTELGQVIADAAREVWAVMPLDRLDGVMIADTGGFDECGRFLADYAAFDGVVDEGRLKLWATLPRAVGEVLVRDGSEDDYRLALQMVVSALMRVAGASELDRLSAQYFRSEVCMHHRGVVAALPAYFGLGSLPSDDIRLSKLVDAAVDEAFLRADDQIEEIKNAFAANGDSAVFARAVAECVAMVACASAAAAGLGRGELAAFPRFESALRARGLMSWFNRFARDLCLFWDEPRALVDPSAWAIHSERLLLGWGVVSWYVAPGRVRFWLPPAEITGPMREGLKAMAATIEGATTPALATS